MNEVTKCGIAWLVNCNEASAEANQSLRHAEEADSLLAVQFVQPRTAVGLNCWPTSDLFCLACKTNLD